MAKSLCTVLLVLVALSAMTLVSGFDLLEKNPELHRQTLTNKKPNLNTLKQVVVGITNYCWENLSLDSNYTKIVYGSWADAPPPSSIYANGTAGVFMAKYVDGKPITNGTSVYVNKAQWGYMRPLVVSFYAVASEVTIHTLSPIGVPVVITEAQLGPTYVVNVLVGNGTHTSMMC